MPAAGAARGRAVACAAAVSSLRAASVAALSNVAPTARWRLAASSSQAAAAAYRSSRIASRRGGRAPPREGSGEPPQLVPPPTEQAPADAVDGPQAGVRLEGCVGELGGAA